MSRPGGNITGATALAVELAPKRLELAHELVPTASVIAALINPTNRASAEPQLRDLQAAAHTLGLQLRIVHMPAPSAISIWSLRTWPSSGPARS
jgi:putative ABC transport system substrate-binding protein